MSSFKFCPMCGEKMVFKKPEFDHFERNSCSKCDFIHYNNSVPTASAVIMNDKDEVLLVTRAWHPYKGYLDLPGGFLEGGEHPLDGVVREAKEELNVDIEVIDFLGTEMGIYSDGNAESENVHSSGVSTLNLYYSAKIIHGELTCSDEIAGYSWYSKSEVLEKIEKVAFNGNRTILLTVCS